MSDLNVTAIPLKPLESPKDGVTASSQRIAYVTDGAQQIKPEHKAKAPATKTTDLNYSIDHEDQAIHLKVKSSDGVVLREVVFERIDPNLLNTTRLKGVLFDSNS